MILHTFTVYKITHTYIYIYYGILRKINVMFIIFLENIIQWKY